MYEAQRDTDGKTPTEEERGRERDDGGGKGDASIPTYFLLFGGARGNVRAAAHIAYHSLQHCGHFHYL